MHHLYAGAGAVGLAPAPGAGSDLTKKCFGSGPATLEETLRKFLLC